MVDLLWLQEFQVQLAKSEDMQIIRDLVDSLEDRRSILDHLEQLRDGCEFLNLSFTSCFGVNCACFLTDFIYSTL